MTLIILDADCIAFRSSVVSTRVDDWGDDPEDGGRGEAVDHDQAADLALNISFEWAGALKQKSPSVKVAVSDPKNFRHDLWDGYKAGRSEKPKAYATALRALLEHYDVLCYPGLEADDTMGLHAGSETILVSNDKDMKTIPGRHYDPIKRQAFRISRRVADYRWLYQTLVGDVVDGYKGCPGVGPKTVERVLKPLFESDRHDEQFVDDAYYATRRLFEARGYDEHFALLQARLARILRPGEYDTRTNQPKLWSP